MKIAVIKLGARITWETSGGVAPGEAVSLCKALKRGGAEVHVFTALSKRDTLHESLIWHDILTDRDTSELDMLVIINGTVNFFGGKEDRGQALNYEVINQFKGAVVYMMCDPYLPLLQIWKNVQDKQVDPKLGWENTYLEENVLITRTDISLCSQSYNLENMKKFWVKKGGVPIDEIFHASLDRFPFLNDWLEPAPHPTVDLMYGGTPRGGRRIPNLHKWYWNLPRDLRVEIFGTIDRSDFEKHPKVGQKVTYLQEVEHAPNFTGKVKYDEVLPKMNNALATLICGDPDYEPLDIIPQRVAECIAAGNLVFIDANMDPSRRIYPVGTEAHNFLYVTSPESLASRLQSVKQDPGVRQFLIDEQRKATDFDADRFSKTLVAKLEWFL